MSRPTEFLTFSDAIENMLSRLKYGGMPVDAGRWQGVPTEGKPDLVTMELTDVVFSCPIPATDDSDPMHQSRLGQLNDAIKPSQPWADDHFEERVSRIPSNPGEQYKNWPWWQGGMQAVVSNAAPGSMIEYQPTYGEPTPTNFKFTHTYQERYWPRYAGHPEDINLAMMRYGGGYQNKGIRYRYGDLDDLISLLLREPYTRQAWLPIFFPEDIGAVHGGRTPCTLGYHFLLREGKLSMWYVIRSCDAIRHFRDDLYLSARLLLWVLHELRRRTDLEIEGRGETPWYEVQPGIFHFHCFSLHYHRGDGHLLGGA